METMYERIKRMTPEEMKDFVYWVYLNGNKDGANGYKDSPGTYFGGYMLTMNAKQVMPSDTIADLWDILNDSPSGMETNELQCVILCLDEGFGIFADIIPFSEVYKFTAREPKIGMQFDVPSEFNESGILNCEVIDICDSVEKARHIAENAYTK